MALVKQNNTQDFKIVDLMVNDQLTLGNTAKDLNVEKSECLSIR